MLRTLRVDRSMVPKAAHNKSAVTPAASRWRKLRAIIVRQVAKRNTSSMVQ